MKEANFCVEVDLLSICIDEKEKNFAKILLTTCYNILGEKNVL